MKLGEMEFYELIQPVDRNYGVFREEGYLVWCGSVIEGKDGKYYLYYSRWPIETRHEGWVTHSEIGYAVSDSPYGGFKPQGLALGAGAPGSWDANVVHNPTVLEFDGTYYMYYMGDHGNGEYWNHRDRQRIGVAIAKDPKGPWKRFDRPLIDVTEGSFDSLLTTNPSVTRGPDGKFYMMYKGVLDNHTEKGGPLACGMAIADCPEGPFVKEGKPMMVNPENNWSVEDPYIWVQDGQFYALVKDFQGYFTGHGINTVALFESQDGKDWKPAKHPFAFGRTIRWTDGTSTTLEALERPQLLLKDGKPQVLYCAAADTKDRMTSFQLAIPLKMPE